MKTSIICLAIVLLASIAQASPVLDAPHNEFSCKECHSYSLWWKYSTGHSDPVQWATQVEAICGKCHGQGGSAIHVVTHFKYTAVLPEDPPASDDFSRICTDCHDPMFQSQLQWRGTVAKNDLYLVTGNLTPNSIVVSPQAPYTSTFHFDPLDPADIRQKWTNAISPWTAKSGTAGRGLILVLSTTTAANTFEVVGVDEAAGTITVNGKIPITEGTIVPPFDYNVGVEFGLIYGQMIRKEIVGPLGTKHNVKFFDPYGGFVDVSGNNDGICQVCHSSTDHFRYDAINAGEDQHADGATRRCTDCHKHDGGFAPDAVVTGRHPEHLAMGISCGACHEGYVHEGDPIVPVEPLTATGCDTCHQDGTGDPVADQGYRTHWNDPNPYALTCASCHSKPPAYTNGSPKANSHAAHADSACNVCHASTTADGNSIIITTTNNQGVITTSTDHVNDDYDVNPAANVTFTYTFAATGGTCTTISCHGGGTATWGSPQTATCQSCHLGPVENDDFAGTFYDNDIISKIGDSGDSNWYTTGHGRPTASGAYLSGNAAADFTAANACLYCHDNTITHKTAANPFRLRNIADVTWGKNGVCQNCHAAGSAGVSVDATVRNGISKIGSIHYGAKHGAGNNGGNFCWDCHDAHGDGNVFMIQAAVAKTSNATTGAPTSTVETVFTSFATGADYAKTTAPFNGICQVCHTTTAYYNPTANGHSTAKCTTCHVHWDNRGFAGGVSGKHPEHLAMGTSCNVCHFAGSQTLDPLVISGCNTCHKDVSGVPVNDQSYRDHWFDGPGYSLSCDSCHNNPPAYSNGEPKANSHAAHLDSTCDACHFATTTDGTSITTPTKHANNAFEVNPDLVSGVTLTYTFAATGGTCTNISCHGSNAATWGGSALTCQDCHLGSVEVENFTGTFYDNGIITKIADSGDSNWYTTGHGRPAAAGDYLSGNAAADLTAPNACLYCHDNTINHKTVINPYRLRNLADPAWGKNAVCQNCHATGSPGVMVDGTLKNASSKIGSDHYGTKHGAANSGGQFCWDCHDSHGDNNAYMIHAEMAKTSDAITGAPTSRVATVFTAFASGSDYARTSAPYNGICQVCHTTTTYYNPTANGHSTEKCTTCHVHSDGRGFGGGVSGKHQVHLAMGMSCDLCHVPGGPRDLDPSTATGCTTCHNNGLGGSPNDQSYRTHWSDSNYSLTCNSCHKGRLKIEDVLNTVNYTHQPADTVCDTCHDNTVADTENYAHLPGDTDCSICHDGPGPNDLTNFHEAPVGMQTNGHTRLASSKWMRQYACYYCHTESVNAAGELKAKHLNHIVDVKIDSYWDIVGQDAPAYIVATKTCLNVYCHTDGTTLAPEMRDYAWDGGHQECNACHGHAPSAQGCTACHDDERDGSYWDNFPEKKWLSAMPMYPNEGPGRDKANSHNRHLFTGFSCDDCHAETITGSSCTTCHGTTIPTTGNMGENKHINPGVHVNRVKNVAFKKGGFYDTSTKTCRNTACHTGRAPQWGSDHEVCRECHGDANVDVDDFGAFNDTRAKINLTQWADTGHGRPGVIDPATGMPELTTNPYASGNPPANFPDLGCWYCHDSRVLHKNEEDPFRLIQHEHFKKRFEKECVFCHMQGLDGECLGCHNTVGGGLSLAPQLSAIPALPGVINPPYATDRPDHSGYTGGGCGVSSCHDSDAVRHKTGSDLSWTPEQKEDVQNSYVQMGVCLICHDDDSSNQCTTCHTAPPEEPLKYSLGFDPADLDPFLAGKTGGRITAQMSKASSSHFGYKHDMDYQASLLADPLDTGTVDTVSTSTREVRRDSTRPAWTPNAFIGRRVTILSGANANTSLMIVRNSEDVLTLSPSLPFGQQLQLGDTYEIRDVVWKGGKFCWDCHDPHGDDNIYMIQNEISTRTDGVTGKPLDRREVTFTRKSTGLDYVRTVPNPETGQYDGLCNVCHTNSEMHFTTTKGENHNTGRICTECHEHRFTDSHADDQPCYTCHTNRPVPRHTGFSQARDCTKCHKDAIGGRMNIMRQFSANSHHVQSDEVTNKHCYACHWESTKDGVINTEYHAGYNNKTHDTDPNKEVDLVVWQAGVRPPEHNNDTAVSFLASKIDTTKPGNTLAGQRGEVGKVTSHCLSCHSDQNNDTAPFNLVDPEHGDCKTPRQYAWDRASIAARYGNSGTATLGKYTTSNAAKKNITKAFSAHGNAVANEGGINAATGVDATFIPLSDNSRAGLFNIECFDCHSSHGSMVTGITSSYPTFNGTKNGGNLKETQSGKGGYKNSYKATANTDPNSVNPYQAGAGQCFDCHETALTNTTISQTAKTPWGYADTFGASDRIKGYRDNPRFKGAYSGASQFSSYRASKQTNGGHFKASSALNAAAMGTIDGLCTPCHDPHGVSPALGDKAAYAVPLLKGTWLSSPYKEDGPPSEGTSYRTFYNRYNTWSGTKPYPQKADPQPAGVWRTDRNTFNLANLSVQANQPVAYGQVSEDAETFAGLCLSCHPKQNLTTEASVTPTPSLTWKSSARIHRSVKGWGATASETPREHSFTCSKCHQPHASGLPRLMQTNCLDGQHRGKLGTGGVPGATSGSNYVGHYPYGWFDNGTFAGSSTIICHGAANASQPPPNNTWPRNQGWNSVTPWTGGQ